MWSVLLLSLAAGELQVTTTGFLDTRATFAVTRLDGTPGLVPLAEGNLQVKVNPTEQFRIFTDTSLVWQSAFLVQGGEKDLAQYRPQAVLSELYAEGQPHEHLRLLAGKKRIVWGTGLSFNPTDLLNPPKDPTDPTLQRAGAWLAQVEVPFERVTVSAVAAGKVTRQFAGLPTALIVSPHNQSAESVKGWVPDDRDDQAHWAAMARVYVLVWDTDVTLSYAFTNLYNDSFKNKSRGGLSLSRTFGGLELHAEGLLFTGSSRLEVVDGCEDAPVLCIARGQAPVERPFLDSSFVNLKGVVGGRYQFDDDSMLTVEYFFNGDGHDEAGFRKLAGLAVKNPQLADALRGAAADPGSPQKFTFDPLRRHYLAASFQKPRIFDDWTIFFSLLAGLEDLSFQGMAQLTWMPKEWLSLSAAVYVPFDGIPAWGVDVGDGERRGEFGLSGFGSRFLLQGRVFF